MIVRVVATGIGHEGNVNRVGELLERAPEYGSDHHVNIPWKLNLIISLIVTGVC